MSGASWMFEACWFRIACAGAFLVSGFMLTLGILGISGTVGLRVVLILGLGLSISAGHCCRRQDHEREQRCSRSSQDVEGHVSS